MERAALGNSELEVGRLGLGCGGPSRFGARTHGDRDASVRLVRRAVELGCTLIDTAESYGTEPIIAEALGQMPASERDRVVICTKKSAADWGDGGPQDLVSPEEYGAGIDACLARLGVDRVGIFMVHGVTDFELPHATERILPVLERARDAGKLGVVGVSEHFNTDKRHAALDRVLSDDHWANARSAVMVGFNAMQQTARETVLPRCAELGAGMIAMFAVRKAITNPERLAEVLARLVDSGEIDQGEIDATDPVGSLSPDGTAAGLIGAAYRFVLAEPGIHVALTGTGSIEHLEANIRAVSEGDPGTDKAWAERVRRVSAILE